MLTKITIAAVALLALLAAPGLVSAQENTGKHLAVSRLHIVNVAHTQHRANGSAYVRNLPGAFDRAYGYVPARTPQYQSPRNIFPSYPSVRQTYQNPDWGVFSENPNGG